MHSARSLHKGMRNRARSLRSSSKLQEVELKRPHLIRGDSHPSLPAQRSAVRCLKSFGGKMPHPPAPPGYSTASLSLQFKIFITIRQVFPSWIFKAQRNGLGCPKQKEGEKKTTQNTNSPKQNNQVSVKKKKQNPKKPQQARNKERVIRMLARLGGSPTASLTIPVTSATTSQ